MKRCFRMLLPGLTAMLPVMATAETVDDPARACQAHAIAMVAEMQASRATPLSADERALVRSTAQRSCLAQTGANAPVVPEPSAAANVGTAASATTAATSAPAAAEARPASKPAPDRGFLGALDALVRDGSTRTDGHKRLQRRGRR